MEIILKIFATLGFLVLLISLAREIIPGLSIFPNKRFANLYLKSFSRSDVLFSRLFSNAYLQLLGIYFINRLTIILFAALAYALIEGVGVNLVADFEQIWLRWDAKHYVYLAQHGYAGEGEAAQLIVFYPLYPLLIKCVSYVIGNEFFSAVLLSHIALVFAIFLLYRLCLIEYGDESVGKSAVKFMLLFPVSFFASMAYTEALFLALTIGSFYFIRQERWYLAGVLGLLAACTRMQGVLLVLPLAYEGLRLSLTAHGQGKRWHLHNYIAVLAACVMTVSGFLIYLVINYVVAGDPWRFVDFQQSHWWQSFSFYADNLGNIYQRIGPRPAGLSIGTWLPTVALFTAALLVLLLARRSLPGVYLLYSVAMMLVSYSPSWLISGPRYLLVVFPLYMALAKCLRTRPVSTWQMDWVLAVSLMLMIVAYLNGFVF